MIQLLTSYEIDNNLDLFFVKCQVCVQTHLRLSRTAPAPQVVADRRLLANQRDVVSHSETMNGLSCQYSLILQISVKKRRNFLCVSRVNTRGIKLCPDSSVPLAATAAWCTACFVYSLSHSLAHFLYLKAIAHSRGEKRVSARSVVAGKKGVSETERVGKIDATQN